MSDIRRVLRLAGFRLLASAFLTNVVLVLTAALCAAILARVASIMFGFRPDWYQLAMWGGVGVVALALVWTLVRAPRAAVVARRVDEGADLKETLSTALIVEKNPDAWCRNVIEAASAKARTLNVAQAVPVRAPRQWPMQAFAARNSSRLTPETLTNAPISRNIGITPKV